MSGRIDAEIHVAAAAAMLDLDMTPATREAVASNLANLRIMAGLFMAIDLADDVDPAPVFWP